MKYTKNTVTVTPATPDHLDALAAAYPERGMAIFTRYLQAAEYGDRTFLVAMVNDMPVGYLTIMWQSNYKPFQQLHAPEILDVMVHPDYRRQGVGRALMTMAERHVMDDERTHIGLGVAISNEFGPAQRFYTSIGYTPDGTGLWSHGTNQHHGDNVTLDDFTMIMMIKDLQEAS